MARNVIEYLPSQADVVSYSAYNSTKTVTGPLIYRQTGATAEDNYFGPPPVGYDDPTQDTGLTGWESVAVLKYSDTKHWVFLQRGFQVTSATIRIAAYEYDIPTSQYTYKGIINCTPYDGSGTSWYGLKAVMNRYSTGTVAVSGTTVTGTGSDWINKGISYGCRIGFGSTNPASISTWYKVSSFPEADRVGFTGGQVVTVAVDSSDNMYVGGYFTGYTDSNGTAHAVNRIIKLSSDGTVDATFKTNIGTGANSNIYFIKIEPISGKLYVGGIFTTFNGSSTPYIVRLNTNGTIDTSFVIGTGFNNTTRDIIFDSSGSAYVIGNFTTWKGVAYNRIIKLDSVGTADATFAIGTGFNSQPYCIAWGEANRIYVGGNFTTYQGVTNNKIIKLDTTGARDATFVTGTGFQAGQDGIYCLVYDSVNNQIVCGGAFTTYNGVANSYLTKLSATGTALFSNASNAAPYSMVSDGTSIYVTGSMSTLGGITCNTFGKINLSNLVADSTFDNNGPVTTGGIASGNGIILNSAGTKVIIPSADIGATSQNRGMVVLNTSDGSYDSTYHRLGVQKMTINTSAGTISAGTPYVIEDLRLINTRASSSLGIYMVKGISWLDFIPATTAIAAPVHGLGFSSGAYYLVDTGTTTLATQIGVAAGTNIEPFVDENNQWLYAMNQNGRVAAFNIRKQMKCYATSRIRYGSTPTLYDYLLTNSPGLTFTTTWIDAPLCTTSSGTSAGIKSFYATAASTVYQFPFSSIAHGQTPTFNTMAEIPPGSTTTYAATATMQRIQYCPEIDRLIIFTVPSSGQKSYITRFRNDMITPTLSGTVWDRDTWNTLINNNSFDRAFLSWNRLLQNSNATAGAPKYPDTGGNSYGFSAGLSDGIMHVVRPFNSVENILYSIPIGADADYVSTSNNVLITPKYTIPNLINFTGLYFNTLREYGSGVYSIPPEQIFVDFRTTGIDDNTGAWTSYDDIDTLNGLLCNRATQNVTIQFRFRFRVAGNTCVPNRLYGFLIAYEDDRSDSHYSPSVTESSLNNRIFAWQQQTSWGSTIPNLKIRVYNASNGDLLLYDTVTESANGVWQYSTDGTTWNAWSSSADAVGNYIRYTADYIPSGFKLRVGLTTA